MPISHVFAGIATADFARALEWYERFFGREPDRFPHDQEAVWELTDTGLLYRVADAERAGDGLVTLIVDDIDNWMSELASCGGPTGQIDTSLGLVRRTTVVDLDGNTIQIGQVHGPGG